MRYMEEPMIIREHETTAMLKDGVAVIICSCDEFNCGALELVADDLRSRGII